MPSSKRANARRLKLLSVPMLLAAVPLALLAAMPARAEFLPPVEQIVESNELPQVLELMRQMGSEHDPDPQAMLVALDSTLAKLREPTKFRGIVQFYRTGLLVDQDRNAEALDAVEESVRLLPAYSGPLIAAAWAYSYSERPGRGADYLLRAIEKDPDAVRNVDDYEIGNLLQRLKNARDEKRIEAVSARLLEIGWIGTDVSTRSGLALETIRRRMIRGDVDGARALVPKLVAPSHSRSLLADNAFKEIWADVDQWGGPKLKRQWEIYFGEARARWVASESLDALKDYSLALRQAGHRGTLIREVFPLYLQTLDPIESYDLIFVAADVVSALADEGRWQDIDTLYSKAASTWPLGSDANALNISANRARWLLFRGSFEEALKLMDAVLADAKKWGPVVNSDALATMHLYRACMLHELGRKNEAQVSAAFALAGSTPDNAAYLHLCMGDPAAARKVLIAGLSKSETRNDVLAFVQKSDDPVAQSDYSRKRRAQSEALRSDPVLLAEVAKYGRVLPYTLSEGAPPETQ